MDPQSYSEARTRPSLEERLESIISGAALMADSSCTRDDRRERIVQECTVVRQALQDLLSEYMNNVSVLLGQSSAALLYFMSLSTLVGWQEGHLACKNLCQLGPNVCPVKEPSFACLRRFSWHVRRTADRPTIGRILEKGHWSDWASALHNYNRLLSL